jgi:hypothetical protein
MFKSYEYIRSLGYDEATKQYQAEYKIADTDFEDVVVLGMASIATDGGGSAAVINCYTKRNLPVASNLIRYMLGVQEKYDWPLDKQVEWNKAYNPRWKEVEKDLQMYLLFS